MTAAKVAAKAAADEAQSKIRANRSSHVRSPVLFPHRCQCLHNRARRKVSAYTVGFICRFRRFGGSIHEGALR